MIDRENAMISQACGLLEAQMFERYTEKARRVIFFARYEASQLGLLMINSDCLLLGILRESHDLESRWLGMAAWEVSEAVARHTPLTGERVATSVDMPLTGEAKRVLAHAAQEADFMGHRHIGTEHLFLGLLHEPETFAARTLKGRGIAIEKVRADLAEDGTRPPVRPAPDAWRGQTLTLQLEGGKEVATVAWGVRIPAIGESIRLVTDSGDGSIYRILDVQWRAQNSPAETPTTNPPLFQVSSVLLTVRQEQA